MSSGIKRKALKLVKMLNYQDPELSQALDPAIYFNILTSLFIQLNQLFLSDYPIFFFNILNKMSSFCNYLRGYLSILG